MNANDFIPLLGLTFDDAKVKAFLASCRITKKPKVTSDDHEPNVANPKMGMELTFSDERFLDVPSEDYEEGALVLSNVTMYGDGSPHFDRFKGDLPHDLKFEFGQKEVQAKIGKKPGWENKGIKSARWDFDKYCLFVEFDKDYKKIRSVAIQLPVA